MSIFKGDLSATIPIYVTRPAGAKGETGSVSMSIWMILLVQMLLWANAVVWGFVGLYEAGRLVL